MTGTPASWQVAQNALRSISPLCTVWWETTYTAAPGGSRLQLRPHHEVGEDRRGRRDALRAASACAQGRHRPRRIDDLTNPQARQWLCHMDHLTAPRASTGHTTSTRPPRTPYTSLCRLETTQA